MKILFLCKYNAFRSKVAEAYFNKINKDKKNTAISRGFIIGGKADKSQRKIARKFGAEIKGTQKCASLQDLIKADKIIVVANDVPEIMLNYQLVDLRKKVIRWKIKDEQKENEKNLEKIVKKIIKKVEKFVNNINKRKSK